MLLARRFLIEGMVEGKLRSVIVTGDIRAEDWWLASLRRHPVLGKYLAWDGALVASTSKDVKGKARATEQDAAPSRPRLDNIYLDTSCVLVDEELVPKVRRAKARLLSSRIDLVALAGRSHTLARPAHRRVPSLDQVLPQQLDVGLRGICCCLSGSVRPLTGPHRTGNAQGDPSSVRRASPWPLLSGTRQIIQLTSVSVPDPPRLVQAQHLFGQRPAALAVRLPSRLPRYSLHLKAAPLPRMRTTMEM